MHCRQIMLTAAWVLTRAAEKHTIRSRVAENLDIALSCWTIKMVKRQRTAKCKFKEICTMLNLM